MGIQTLFYTKFLLYFVSTVLAAAWLSILVANVDASFLVGTRAALGAAGVTAVWSFIMVVVYLASNGSSRIWLLTPPLFVTELVVTGTVFYLFNAVQIYIQTLNLNMPESDRGKEVALYLIGWTEALVLIALIILVAVSRNADYFSETDEELALNQEKKDKKRSTSYDNVVEKSSSAVKSVSSARPIPILREHDTGLSGPVTSQEPMVYDVDPAAMAKTPDAERPHLTGPPVIQYQAPPVVVQTSGSIEGTSGLSGGLSSSDLPMPQLGRRGSQPGS